MTRPNQAVALAAIPTELRRVCGHDSRSVDGCLYCEAADLIESMRTVGIRQETKIMRLESGTQPSPASSAEPVAYPCRDKSPCPDTTSCEIEGRCIRCDNAPTPPAEPSKVEALKEALEIGLDFARASLAEAQSLYGDYPRDGLGRKVTAAEREVAVIESALRALATQPKAEPAGVLDLSSHCCGYARIEDGEYKLAGMRTTLVMSDGQLHPIYAIPDDLIERLHAISAAPAAPQDKEADRD